MKKCAVSCASWVLMFVLGLFGSLPDVAHARDLLGVSDTGSGIKIKVVASSMPNPNAQGSSAYSTYTTNARNSLGGELGNIGNPATHPGAYERFDQTITPGRLIATPGARSWMGIANYPGAFFAQERGNYFTFGYVVEGDGSMQFRLNNFLFLTTSSDPLRFGHSGSLAAHAGYSYGGICYGVDYGPDRTEGTLDDVFVNGGPASILVDKLVFVGIPGGVEIGYPTPNLQAEIDSISNYLIMMQTSISHTLILRDDTGNQVLASGTKTINIVPTPSGSCLALLGAFMVVSRRRR